MPNPVTDRLKDWQNDADAADTNAPINATLMGDGQAGDLDGEFRMLKSEIRALSIIMSWERWLGLKNLAATGNIAFTFVSGTQFRVNDDFTSVSRLVAVVGRRVRAFITGSTLYGTITAATFVSPNTTITVSWDAGVLDATLTEVQFGPELRSIQGLTGASNGQFLRFNGTLWVPATLVAADIPSLDASKITTGQLAVARGGTGQDFAAIAQGNILYFSAAGVLSALGPGVSGQFLKTQGAGANPIWADMVGNISIQVFTASGTYTKPAGLIAARVIVIGGGGGSGGTASEGTGGTTGGGGGGGYSESLLTAASIGATETVTVGAGGAAGATQAPGGTGGSSSFSTLVTANGGLGSPGTNTETNNIGGSGATAGTGNIALPGGDGHPGTGLTFGGNGGSSLFGISAKHGTVGKANTGGGGGGTTGINNSGFAGGLGIVIVIEYKR